MQRNEFRGVARFLYNHNPFYLVSAGLILYGLHAASARTDWGAARAWNLAAGLCGYTIVMAVTAVLVVRLGKVWDDARTILLVLLLQFIAVSVSFDELCRTNHEVAARVLPACFLFTLLVSECVLRFLKMRLPWLYRGPYYLLLGLMFGYPLLLSGKLTGLSHSATSWLLAGFPAVCGLAFLTLIPAVRRGAAYASDNGTPWRWPMYPWSIFAFLSFVVCFRSWLLTYSFDPRPVRGFESAFGGYFLVPFGFALLIVLLEGAIARGKEYSQTLALILAPLLMLAALPIGESATFRAFLADVVDSAGSPIWLALVGLFTFYCYAWLRGVKGAENGIIFALLIASFVGPKTVGLATVEPAKWWPWAAISAVLFLQQFRRPSSSRFFLASTAAIVAFLLTVRGTWIADHGVIVSFHFVMLGALIAGMMFRDRAAVLFRGLAALMTFVGCWSAILTGFEKSQIVAAVAYLVLVTIACFQLWRLSRYRSWLWAAFANTTTFGLLIVAAAYGVLYQHVQLRAFVALAIGSVTFCAAALISAHKCGLLREIQTWIIRLLDDQGNRSSRAVDRRPM